MEGKRKSIDLTMWLSVHDGYFRDIKHDSKLNAYELAEHDVSEIDQSDLVNLVVEKIVNTEENLIIGQAFRNLEECLQIRQRLAPLQIEISRIYFPSLKSMEAYLSFHATHNRRWIGDPPGEMEARINRLMKETYKLRRGLKSTSVELIEVD